MASRNHLRDAATYGSKLTKAERKIAKKQAKKLNILQRHNAELANISVEPTPHLLVGNGGLMCGIERNHLANLFGRFGTVKEIVMLPKRSYSFLTFEKTMEARAAFDKLHGRSLESPSEFPRSGVKFYLSYLLNVPIESRGSQKQLPPGLTIIKNFLSEQEEKELLETLGWQTDNSPIDDTVDQELHHRKVKHYGYEFQYKTNNVDITKPLPGGIPSVCDNVIKSMMTLGIVKFKPDQLTINQYEPGQGIPPHVDTHSAFESEIISVSLGDQVTMEFRHPDGSHLPVILPRRSLAVMSGESRYLWTHGITPRKFDVIHEEDRKGSQSECNATTATSGITLHKRGKRLSFTFRKVRGSPCNCNYKQHCDSQNSREMSSSETTNLPCSQKEAEELEKRHVHEVYENIAEHFSGTRHSPWPKIAEFLKSQPNGSLIADVGCGNGKYLGVNENSFSTGSDRSFNLAAICKQRGYSVIVCDILWLPYRSNAFDVCICIAVLHHLATDERRLAALKELVRVVRSGGQILLYVWALEQDLEKIKMERLKEKEFCDETLISLSHKSKSIKEDTKRSELDSSNCENVESHPFEQKKDEGETAVSKESHERFCSFNSAVGHGGDSHKSKPIKEALKRSDLDSSNCENVVSYPLEQKEDEEETAVTKKSNESFSSFNSAVDHAGDSWKLRVNENRNVFEQQDVFVPWKYRGVNKSKTAKKESKEKSECAQTLSSTQDTERVYHRFYHVFKEGELVGLCKRLDNVVVRRHYYEKGNWCVLLEKLND